MTYGGFPYTPPDSTGAIGPLHYVEMVNSRIAVYDRNLNVVTAPTELWTFVGNSAFVPYCDPQILWAPSANRWLFSFLYCGNDPANQGFVIGWSKTSDPTTLSPTGWCRFASITGAPLFDYMKLGHNSNYMILGGNLYANPTTANPSFSSAAIKWVTLPANGDQSCTPPQLSGTTANPLKNGDGVSNTFTPVPVNTYTSATDGYILAAYDPSGNNGQAPTPRARVAVWHLDAAGVLRADNDVAVNTYNTPSSAPQSGSSYVLDTLDARLTQAVGDPTAGFYTQHTALDPLGRSEVHWYEFIVSGPNVVLAQQGRINDPGGDWVFNAAISPRFDGLGAAIIYNRSSLNTRPLIAAQIRYQATPLGTMAAGELALGMGVNPATDSTCVAPIGPPCRWGDYAAATPDPVQTKLVWGTNQVNVNSGSGPGWFTQNFAIAPTPEAPTNVRASASRSNTATVSWTPAASDPGAPPTSYTVFSYINGSGAAAMTIAAPATTLNFTGLTIGATYWFTVIANCALGPSLESARSNSVVSGDGALQSAPASPPPRQAVNQSALASPPTGR